MSRCAVLVFAKAPVPGTVKTRLAGALGADGAARLAQRMLQHTLREACAAGIGPVTLCGAPDVAHPAFTALARQHGVALRAQGEGDLGARLARAFAHALRTQPMALLVGTDAPALDAAVLRHARDALAAHDAVFVPALDGGYALVGLRACAPALFERMPWSTPAVMADTRARIAALGLSHAELPPLADVDEPRDLVHLPPGWLH